ncbi:MAG: hypothetical protein PHY09_02280 [Desulfuromonadaceae bacterium]|nr:hypothetical protein [Desulfuromonadaceae bacterium]MDD5105573.1 hypothetical protein [Desulfuromonadaceae bacterium]
MFDNIGDGNATFKATTIKKEGAGLEYCFAASGVENKIIGQRQKVTAVTDQALNAQYLPLHQRRILRLYPAEIAKCAMVAFSSILRF